jgi:phosphoribosyl-dephospho-CoA transferase
MDEDKPKEVPHSLQKDILKEAHKEIDEINVTRKTITDLVNFRRTLHGDVRDNEKLNEIKDKALDAIDHLFDDEGDSEEK